MPKFLRLSKDKINRQRTSKERLFFWQLNNRPPQRSWFYLQSPATLDDLVNIWWLSRDPRKKSESITEKCVLALAKKEGFNIVTRSISVAQTCPQRQNRSKCYSWSFPNLECDFNFLFHNVMASRRFILDPQIVQKGKHEKIVPGFYMTSTWEWN